jgi:SpoVK/Ycf46/Vps4 family AAA+-type ATPase
LQRLALSVFLLQALSWPLRYAEEAAQLGVRWPKGLLLHGPPGCGKTAAVHAIAKECGAAVHLLTAANIVGSFTGEQA